MKYLTKRSVLLLAIILLSLPIVMPFFQRGFFPSHDGEWAVVRLSDMYREIKDGQFPARFSGNLNFGYGYPLFNFAYPFPYYLGLAPFLMHIGLVNSIKILFAISVPLSGIAMFFAAREIWESDEAGFISSVMYLYLPYRMVDLFVRGSLGESIASITFPIILFSLSYLAKKRSLWVAGLLGISVSVLIMTHNIMAVLFSIVIGAYLLCLIMRKKVDSMVLILSSLILGFGISAFFWLPALVEKQFILLSKVPIADRDLYYVTFKQLLFSPFGYGTPTESNPFTYQIGIPQVIALGLGVVIAVRQFISTKKNVYELFIFSMVAGIFIFMMFPVSKFVWEHTPFFKEINYPWTVLLPLGFVISLIGGKVFSQSKRMTIFGLILCLFAIGLVFPHARPSEYIDRGDGFYFTNDATTTSSSELMPLTVKTFPVTRPSAKVEIIDGKGSVTILKSNSQQASFRVALSSLSTVRLNTIYFPGWHWYKDGKEIAISVTDPGGVMEARLDPGTYTVTAVFHNTPIRTVANIISVVSIALLLLVLSKNILMTFRNSSVFVKKK